MLNPHDLAGVMLLNGVNGIFNCRNIPWVNGTREVCNFCAGLTELLKFGVGKYTLVDPERRWCFAKVTEQLVIAEASKRKENHVTPNVHGDPRASLLRASESTVVLERRAKID